MKVTNCREKLVSSSMWHSVLGHFGFANIHAELWHLFFQPGMSTDLCKSCLLCELCQHHKSNAKKRQGAYHTLPAPRRPFFSVTLNLVRPLPKLSALTCYPSPPTNSTLMQGSLGAWPAMICLAIFDEWVHPLGSLLVLWATETSYLWASSGICFVSNLLFCCEQTGSDVQSCSCQILSIWKQTFEADKQRTWSFKSFQCLSHTDRAAVNIILPWPSTLSTEHCVKIKLLKAQVQSSHVAPSKQSQQVYPWQGNSWQALGTSQGGSR